MDLRKIKKLIELFEESALTEMEINEGESSVRMSRGAPHSAPLVMSAAPVAPALPASASPSSPPPQAASSGVVVESPLVGTFYDSPSPDDTPYVAVGATVNKGDTLCLIEAMKTFNQLEAEVGGVVIKVHKHSGDPVEYGEALFVIEPRGGE